MHTQALFCAGNAKFDSRMRDGRGGGSGGRLICDDHNRQPTPLGDVLVCHCLAWPTHHQLRLDSTRLTTTTPPPPPLPLLSQIKQNKSIMYTLHLVLLLATTKVQGIHNTTVVVQLHKSFHIAPVSRSRSTHTCTYLTPNPRDVHPPEATITCRPLKSYCAYADAHLL